MTADNFTGRHAISKSSIISSTGRLTIPQEIRNRLGLVPGDSVQFVIEGERVAIRRARSEPSVFARYKGKLATVPRGRKQINSWLRELRDKEQDG